VCIFQPFSSPFGITWLSFSSSLMRFLPSQELFDTTKFRYFFSYFALTLCLLSSFSFRFFFLICFRLPLGSFFFRSQCSNPTFCHSSLPLPISFLPVFSDFFYSAPPFAVSESSPSVLLDPFSPLFFFLLGVRIPPFLQKKST